MPHLLAVVNSYSPFPLCFALFTDALPLAGNALANTNVQRLHVLRHKQDDNGPLGLTSTNQLSDGGQTEPTRAYGGQAKTRLTCLPQRETSVCVGMSCTQAGPWECSGAWGPSTTHTSKCRQVAAKALGPQPRRFCFLKMKNSEAIITTTKRKHG